MKHLVLITAIAFCPLPAAAQDTSDSFGFGDLAPLAEGFRDLFEGIAEDMMPLMEQLSDKMTDLNAFEAPEVLPNGDILIRRKPEANPAPSPQPKVNPDGSIDL
ncbi:hypothetical protein [Litoreibacter albidus]|uniref:AAA+ family ATPase n=1 Tax=Litoreibacter albidus TaxID=670155 RepID=A0A1H3B2E6_9RHOB|nr:hypothetical protein [Litoreibacter albidus]SDX36170.1 hypothetical protein SAMN04488001_3029 [Litoreibacter albidus]